MEKNELKKLQEQHRKQMRDNREKIKKRKERAHRLIVRGAIAEGLIANADAMTDEEFQQKLYQMVGKNSE